MAVDETISVEQAVVEFLQVGGTALRVELGDDEVWTGSLPVDSPDSNPVHRKAVVVNMLSEGAPAHGAVTTAIIAFKCYGGAGYDAARKVYRALYARLHNAHGVSTSFGTIVKASMLQGSNPGVEPDTGFPVYHARFAVQWSQD